jgi:hypothetical protein
MSEPNVPRAESTHKVLTLSRWEMRGSGADRCMYEIAVDWKSALTDALSEHNVYSGRVIADFERLCKDPVYAVERS